MYKLQGFIDARGEAKDTFLTPLFLKNGKDFIQHEKGGYVEINLLDIITKNNIFINAAREQVDYAKQHEPVYAFRHNKSVAIYNAPEMIDYLAFIREDIADSSVLAEIDAFDDAYANKGKEL